MPSKQRTRLVSLVSAALIVTVGWLAYGFSLRLPFFLDDMIHYRWLVWHGFADIWSSSRLLGYFRPLPFTLWKALWLLQGRLDRPTLHSINVGLHLLNGLLVLALVAGARRARGRWVGLGAALLFLLFPFSYQAVPWVGALTHPLVTTLTLSSLVLYQTSRRAVPRGGMALVGAKPGNRPLWVASLALALLAPFAHETGVLVAPLLFLLLVTSDEPMHPRQAFRETVPYWLCAGLGLTVWLLVPKEVHLAGHLNLESRWQNTFYFMQGLGYPVAWLATRLTGPGKRLSDLAAIALVSAPVILAWALLLWKAGRGRLVATALGWFVLCAAPAWAMLGFHLVIDGPRLLYEASVGAALFWAIPLDLSFAGRRRQVTVTLLATLVVAGVAGGSYRFIYDRALIYEQSRLAVDELLQAGAGPADEPLLVINYPVWFAPFKGSYAIGHEGVTLAPDYTSVAEMWSMLTGQNRPITAVALPDLQVPWRYWYAVAGGTETAESLAPKLRAARKVLMARYDGPDVAVLDVGALEAEGQPRAARYLAGFDGKIALLAASSERQGASVRLVLQWQCWECLPQDTTVFVHLYNDAGQLMSQADGYPLMGSSHPLFWQPGDKWCDVRVLPLPERLAPGRYTVKAGLYPTNGGARLPAMDPARQRFQDEAVTLGTITIP